MTFFKGHKFDIESQCPIPFGTYASLHYAKKRVMNKYEPHTENGLILYLADSSTHNIAWIPGRNTVATINKFTVIKASPSDFGFQPNNNIILSHIPDFIKSSRQPQEGDQSNNKTQNQKLCSISPSKKNGKNGNPLFPSFPLTHLDL